LRRLPDLRAVLHEVALHDHHRRCDLSGRAVHVADGYLQVAGGALDRREPSVDHSAPALKLPVLMAAFLTLIVVVRRHSCWGAIAGCSTTSASTMSGTLITPERARLR